MKWLRRGILTAVLVIAGGTTLSGATFTTSSNNDANTFTTAADFGVHVTMTPPSGPLRGSVTLAATASETAGGTITNVAIEKSPAGANTWTPACSVAASPYNCSWNSASVSSGLYDFRARATSSSGYTRISETVEDVVVDNTAPSATMTDPGAWFGGSSVPLSSSSSDNANGSGVASVRYEYKLSSNTTWTTACTGSSGPAFSCNFNASSLTTNSLYDFRAVPTDAAGNVGAASTAVTGRRADNAAPTGSFTTPAGMYMRGSVTVGGTASDTHSGVAEVRVQHKVYLGSTWSEACTDSAAPFASCTWDTSAVADNWYEMRVLVIDNAGNQFTSGTGVWRHVDNTKPTVSLTNPGTPLSGTVTLNATASDASGNPLSVSFQRSPAGAGTWTEICNDTASAYSCDWDTGADGTYDLRAVATDSAGNTETSTVIGPVTVDNPPGAADIQTTNGGTAGTVGSGDTLVFTYTDAMNPASIIAGWNGTGGRAVTLNFVNSGANDIMTVRIGGTVLPLTSASGVTVGVNYVGGPGATFNGTLTFNGTTTFTVTIGTTVSGSATNGGVAGNLTWNPSATATTTGGTPVSTSPRGEQGASDIDF